MPFARPQFRIKSLVVAVAVIGLGCWLYRWSLAGGTINFGRDLRTAYLIGVGAWTVGKVSDWYAGA